MTTLKTTLQQLLEKLARPKPLPYPSVMTPKRPPANSVVGPVISNPAYSQGGGSGTTLPPRTLPPGTVYTIGSGGGGGGGGGNGSSNYITHGGGNGPVFSGSPTLGTIHASNIKLDGVSLADTLRTIQERLLILVPDPVKLAKYTALQEAYNQYKVLEALVNEPTE